MTSCGTAGQPRPSDVDSHDGVPGLCREIPNGSVANDSGVVDKDVEAPPFADGPLDHCLSIGFVGNIAVVRNGGSPACTDQFDGQVRVLAGTLTRHRTPQIVDH